MATRKRPRVYESPLRAEQMDRTREKLLAAGTALVADEGGDDLSVRRVAAQAGVSVPTAYRYFPDRDSLLAALGPFIAGQVVNPILPSRTTELPASVRVLFAGFEANDRLVRAQLDSKVGRAIRDKARKGRDAQVLAIVKESFPKAPAATQRRMAALLRAFLNLRTWVMLKEDWSMSGAEAGEVVAWAMSTLLTELRRRPQALAFESPPREG